MLWEHLHLFLYLLLLEKVFKLCKIINKINVHKLLDKLHKMQDHLVEAEIHLILMIILVTAEQVHLVLLMWEQMED